MKFDFIFELEVPRESAWRAFDNPANLFKWQQGLVSYDHVSGPPGQVGSVSELLHREGGHEVKLVETVTIRREPEELAGTYDSSHGRTTMVNHFAELSPGRTLWTVEVQVQLSGMAKFMGPMLKGVIENRVKHDCERFKSLLEAGELSA
ncbi:MAG: SRPBCC family protein [Planctomycetaceae bacterium]|nr:SRPBCC family protein [Planctomycetaceae bacterium]